MDFKEFAEGMKLISEAVVPFIRVIGEVTREQSKADSVLAIEISKMRSEANREDRKLDAEVEREMRVLDAKTEEEIALTKIK